MQMIMVSLIVLHVILVLLPLYRAFVIEEGHGTLISNEVGATCDDYRIINCETGKIPSYAETLYITEGPLQACSANQCATNVSPSYLNKPPLSIFKQVGRIDDNSGMDIRDRYFFVKLKWDLLPDVQHYTVLFKFFSDSEYQAGSNDYSCSEFQALTGCKSHLVSNVTNEVNLSSIFRNVFSTGSTANKHKKLLLKVIAYPVYEWPLLVVDTPFRCLNHASSDWYGCNYCHSCSSDNGLPPNNFTVAQLETEDGVLLTNISWTPQSSALQYYLHINTSEGKQLYTIDKERSHVTLTAGPLAGTAWLESFSCSCSNSTDTIHIPGAFSSSSAISLSTTTSTSSDTHHSSSTFVFTNYTVSATRSTTAPSTDATSSVPVTTSSRYATTPSPSVTPSTSVTSSTSPLSLLQSYTLPIAIMAVVGAVIATISIIALVMSTVTFIIVVKYIHRRSSFAPAAKLPKHHTTNPRAIPVLGKTTQTQDTLRYELASTPPAASATQLVHST